MIRVAIVLQSGYLNWLGGVNYFRSLLGAVYSLPDRKIEPVLFTGRRTPDALIKDFAPFEQVRSALLDHASFFGRWRSALLRIYEKDLLLERLLRKHGISVLSHHAPLGRGITLPTIGWIADFQHRQLPDLFSQGERQRREGEYNAMSSQCARIIVSSGDAQNSLAAFSASGVERSRVLRFVPEIPDVSLVLPDLRELEDKYGFNAPYFHLPNQFWMHKNHGVVIEALDLLRQQQFTATVLATGHTSDSRRPKHFQLLLERIAERDLSHHFKILGVVPYRDLIALMKHSVAVINPSFCEGWSTTVEEAKALGKRIILSNIPVHQEQAPARGSYFDPHSPEELALAIQRNLQEGGPSFDDSFAAQARVKWRENRLAFAEAYQKIVCEARG